MLHPQLLSELEELLRQKGLLENDPQSEIAPKAPVFRGAAPSMPLACPNCEEDDNTSYFDDILGLLNNREADEGRETGTVCRQRAETQFPHPSVRVYRQYGTCRYGCLPPRRYRPPSVLQNPFPTRIIILPSKQRWHYHWRFILSKEQTEEMLASAGHALSQSMVRDIIILFCIEHQIYDLHDVNEILAHFEQPVFGAVL